MDEFSSKTVCVTPQNLNFEKKLDEFSSKTACVTTQKMKILEKFLDEFSKIWPFKSFITPSNSTSLIQVYSSAKMAEHVR